MIKSYRYVTVKKWIFYGLLTALLPLTIVWLAMDSQDPETGDLAERAPADFEDLISDITSPIEVIGTGIFKVIGGVLDVPVKITKAVVITTVVKSKLGGLKPLLPEDVYKRLMKRVNRKDFLDVVIPFIFNLKNHYGPSKTSNFETFEEHLRSIYNPTQTAPGFEHSMFQWKKDEEPSGSGFEFDDEFMALIVELYDATFIKDQPPKVLQSKPSDLFDEFASRPKPDLKIIKNAEIVIKKILKEIGSRLDQKGETKKTLDGIANNAEKLRAASATLVDFIRTTAEKNYRMFAGRVTRQEQLRTWMNKELRKEQKIKEKSEWGKGPLWQYLRHANRSRRYVIHVVVDGLQGELLRSLSRNDAPDLFLRQILEDKKELIIKNPAKIRSKAAAKTNVNFLEYRSENHLDDDSYLPFFKELRREHSYGFVRRGISSTPTISVRNLPIVKTGAPVAGPKSTGIPNFHFVSRNEDRAYYFWGNDAFLLPYIAKENGLVSMPERLHQFNSLSCSSQYDMGVKWSFDVLLNLILGEISRDYGEKICVDELQTRVSTEKTLRRLRKKLFDLHNNLRTFFFGGLNQAKARNYIDKIVELEDSGLPQYVLFYDPWPDHFAHPKGPFSDEIISQSGELARLDYWLGRLRGIYGDAGVLDRTIMGIVGDHGLAPAYFYVTPDNIFKRDPIKVRKISSDEGEGPMLTAINPPSVHELDLIIASTAGGNFMMDFFIWDEGAEKDQREIRWKQQPVFDELVRFKTLSRTVINVPKQILKRLGGALDYMAVRFGNSNLTGTKTIIVGQRGKMALMARIHRRGNRFFYEYRGGSGLTPYPDFIDSYGDLLQVIQQNPYEMLSNKQVYEFDKLKKTCLRSAKLGEVKSWCTLRQWQLLTSYTPRPGSVTQLGHLYDIETAGTVNLFPRAGVGFNSKVPGRHAGETFHEKDAFVGIFGRPLLMSGTQVPRTARNGSLPVSLFEFLTRRPANTKDGFGFPSLIRRKK